MSAAPVPHRLSTPPTTEIPPFPPGRVRGGRLRPGLPGARRGRPTLVAGLALTASALVAAVPAPGAGAGHERAEPPPGHSGRAPDPPAAATVSAPVRIADAAAARLLRPGDRVDVVAARTDGRPGARVLASGVRVAAVPDTQSSGTGVAPAGGETSDGVGALVVLKVERRAAARLAGAGAVSRLAVTVW
jgi:hypothetical protein